MTVMLSIKKWQIYCQFNFIIRGLYKMNEVPKCGCGRSPIENCIGWHALSEEEYLKKKETYEARQDKKLT